MGVGLGVSSAAFAQATPTDAPDGEPALVAAPRPHSRGPRNPVYHSPPGRRSPDAPDWTWWLGAASGVREVGTGADSLRPAVELRLGLGFELTSVPVASYHQMQIGPWVQALGDLAGGLAEGGLELGLTKETFDGSFSGLRIGGGYGVGPSDRGAALSGSLFFGQRHRYGKCANLYHARGWRAFATARTWPTQGRGVTLVAGVEIDPSLLFSGDDDGYWDALDHGSENRCALEL
ncbi:MAG TPA: hypothetical protein VGP07_05160 [Polyangia bacterium]|jgi:hypothetical protein